MRQTRLRPRTGFTLLELMAVVTIISILAALAITKFGDSKRRAYLMTMQTDLRNLATTAESHFVVRNSYDGFVMPSASTGVTLTFTPKAGGYVATAVHSGIPEVTCSIDTSEDQMVPECR